MRKNRFLVILLSVLAVLTLSFSVGCKKPDPEDNDTETQIAFTLNSNSIQLEKLEEYTLVAMVDEQEVTDVAWTTTNNAVATVSNGKVSAVGQGSAVITATYQEEKASCLVNVTDKGLTLGVQTNIALGDKLYMIAEDTFKLEYLVTYNKKVLSDAQVSISIPQNEFVSLENELLTANKEGKTTVTITASWRGLEYSFPVDVEVVSNAFGQIYNETSITLFNDVRGGDVEKTLAPKFFAEEVELTYGDQYVIENWEYDENVVSIDESTLKITSVGKGVTDVIATFKTIDGSIKVDCVLTVNVELYNEDKTEDVTLDTVYLSRENYYIDVADVFVDISGDKLDGMVIDKITDVTGAVLLDVPVADGIVSIANVTPLGITGDRAWQIECPKYSYIVKVSVIEVDPAVNLIGTYHSQTWKYDMKILYSGNDVKAEFYDKADLETLVDSGIVTTTAYTKTADSSYKPLTYDYNGGYFNINGLKTNKVSLPAYPIKGHFAYSNGSMKVGLALDNDDVPAVELYEENIVAQYNMIKGKFGNQQWAGKFTLNEDKTCSFSAPSLSAPINGTYELTPKTPLTGDIKITLDSGYNGQTEITGTYYYSKGGAKIDVTVDGSLRALKTENYNANYENFGTYYSGGWVRIKLYADGTFVFDFPKWSGGWASLGTYELNADGTIKIILIRDYNYNDGFEGTYYVSNGVRKITLEDVKGPGVQTQTYTQFK